MSVRKGYMVVSAAFEYDDNYYNEAGTTFDRHVYRTKEGPDGADAACLSANMEHARNVATCVQDWLREDLGDYVYPNMGGSHNDADLDVLRRVYSIFFPGGDDTLTAPAKVLVNRLNRAPSRGNISDEDALFLCENLEVFCSSRVEEVLVEEWPTTPTEQS